jgi:eukaryotic-like serine/threonine-protein kinase
VWPVCPVCLASPDGDTSRPPPGTAASAAPVAPLDTASFRPPVALTGGTATFGIAPHGAATAPPPPGTASDAGPDFRTGLPPAPPGYDLLRRLGSGGMGDVFLAREHTSERVVAIKFLRSPGNPAAAERFLAEVRALGRLKHPHIVQVLATDFYRLQPYFTMDYASRGNLAERVSASGPLDPAEAARLIATVARAVGAAHAAGVLHRDLKPSNILLADDETPRVSDFGLAKLTDRDDGLTTGSGPLGTPSYMPPEQVSRKYGDPGPAADVYGLGATLYHLLTSRPPFTAETPAEIIVRVEGDPPERPRAIRPDIPLGLEAIVLKCLEKDPARRYATPAELADDLDRFLAGDDPTAPPLTRSRRLRLWARRNRQRLAAAGAVLLLAIALVWIGMLAAPVPKSPPAEPAVEPLQAIRNELAADRRSVLLGASGRPRHARWLIGTATVIEPTDADPAFAFEAPEATQLELLVNPGVEQYRITAEIQLRYHKAIVNKPGKKPTVGLGDVALFGLYCGDSLLATGDGRPVRVSMVAGYTDYYSKEVRDKLPKLQGFAQLQAAAIIPAPDGGLESRTASAGRVLRFPPTDALPTPWRRLRIDVASAGVEVFWAASPTAEWQPVSGRTAAELANDLNQKADRLGVKLAAHAPLVWDPAASCGVWCRGAAIAVQNVVVEVFP